MSSEGVFSLLSDLCRDVSKDRRGVSQPRLARKLRLRAYEILLHKCKDPFVPEKYEGSAVSNLISCYFLKLHNAKSVSGQNAAKELLDCVQALRDKNLCKKESDFNNIIQFLVALKDIDTQSTQPQCHYQPLSFGAVDSALARLPYEESSSALPYQYYPPFLFRLPDVFSMERKTALSYPEYSAQCFSMHNDIKKTTPLTVEGREFRPFQLPSPRDSESPPSLMYPSMNILDCPRLEMPRDLQIPRIATVDLDNNSINKLHAEEVQNETILNVDYPLHIWEIASKLDGDIPIEIWEIAAKMPPVQERPLISSSRREMSLWRSTGHVVSEREFIRHLMYLSIGIESQSFKWSTEHQAFRMRQDLSLEGLSTDSVKGYAADLLFVGTCYKRLYEFAFNYEDIDGAGYVFEAARKVVRHFLLSFRLKATDIYGECFSKKEQSLPTLLQVLRHMEPLRSEIETVASVYRVIDSDTGSRIARGASLMCYLYNEISLITHPRAALLMFRSLYKICAVYFKFIERFIFQGSLEDRHEEFFIRKDIVHAHSRTKRYWERGFRIADTTAVPHFLRPLASHILLCGKSFRLLQLCHPSDPLVQLISQDHPSVKCCTSFEQMESQKRLLDVYRTRCLFVSGQPVTFDQIMLKKEAERKAFTEMATVKQAETLEKIVAERKRLAQLIIAEKQHNLRVLETAIAETEAAKRRNRQRDSHIGELEKAADKARDEADAILRDDEKNKMLQYYSKLNQEVEKRKAQTEWKIKRLQLDAERMKLLSTEERNLKREKFELEHDSCSNSIYSNESVMASSYRNLDDDDAVMREINDNEDITRQTTENEIGITTTVVEIPTDKILDSEGNLVENRTEHSEFASNRRQAIANREKVLAHEYALIETESNTGVISKDSENNIKVRGLWANEEAKRNKVKVQDEDNITERNVLETLREAHTFNTEAKGEAWRNRTKILGTENDAFELNKETFVLQEDVEMSEANSEAKINKIKAQGTYEDEDNITERNVPENLREAHTFNTAAKAEAWRNRTKILGTEYDAFELNRTSAVLQEDDQMSETNTEAKINRIKARGTYDTPDVTKPQTNQYLTEAQKEAIANKQKVLGTEYNLGPIPTKAREPLNAAQEEAVKNRNKVLQSEYGIAVSNDDRRSTLRLDLKKSNERVQDKLLAITSMTGGVTPGEFYAQFELETPTTSEVPFGAPTPSDFDTLGENILSISRHISESLVASDGFKFPSIVLDEEINENVDKEKATEISPSKSDLHLNNHFEKIKSSIWNFENQAYSFEGFDPFGIKGAKIDTRYLSNQMNIDIKKSYYTNPADIFIELQKKPYKDIFRSQIEDDDEETMENGNITTLTACFQRSVLLPLSYQLEVVNNSILTFFLVDLDIYEHLRSLKDYFFLMDGEFSSTICENLFRKLTKTLNPVELLNFATLHSILDKSLGSSIANVNKFSDQLSFVIADPPTAFQHSSPDVLQCLSLSYTVAWPMNIVLSNEALAKYSRVFQFLLKMRRISWTLGQDFEALKVFVKLSDSPRTLLRSPQYTAIQIHRHVLAALIRALDNYIVTTCIHTGWKEFEADLRKAKTLDDLNDCHVAYIKKVLFRCLLNKRSTPLMNLLNDIFTVILRFSHVLRTGTWTLDTDSNQYTHSCFDHLLELFRLFSKLSRQLHRTVARLLDVGYQPHLVALITMIDLNRYYETPAVQDAH